MIERLIHWCLENRILVLLLTAVVIGWGIFSVRNMPMDAIPDLSDVQVIVHTPYPGQAPQVVEDQVTYPLSSALLAVPGARDVRSFSFFGDSFVYVLFEDGTDLHWARSRVLEYLSQVAPRLPEGARPALGPDATGVGWVYKYALVDRTGNHDLSQLRSLQDWFLKVELQAVRGVAEVATLGGMVRQYQAVLDPDRLRAYGLTLDEVRNALLRANEESGGALLEMAEAEYMVRGFGYLRGLDDLAAVPMGREANGTAVLLEDVADVRLGPRIRRGLATLDGEGEVVGGIVVMRHGENPLAVIERVQARLHELRAGLPEGVEIIETYDRSELIESSVANLVEKLWLEFLVVALVCAVFLLHLRSALVAIIALPVGVLVAFIVMQQQGITANILSLGGIAITIGAMVDAAIVMIENAHKRLERAPPGADRFVVIGEAARETGRPLFFALLLIAASFLPLFTLEGQEGRLFSPLAFTGAYAIAAAAGLSVTLVPVLIFYLVRGRIYSEARNPISRALIAGYQPAVGAVLRRPVATLLIVAAIGLTALYPATRLGSEFMPDMDEGDLMYMPTLDPGVSIERVRAFMLQADRLILSVPEVEQVFGKAGRAETATDPAPLGMLETIVRFKPRDDWRPGLTKQDLIRELNAAIDFPGVTNTWVQPIRTRIDMLATGIRTPVGVKIAGPDLDVIQRIGTQVENAVRDIPGTISAFSERTGAGRYIEIHVDRRAAARYGQNVADVQQVVRTAIGGMDVMETVEGLERYPVNVRYPQDWRDTPEALERLPVVTGNGAYVPLGAMAEIRIADGPPMIRSENARPNGWVFVDIAGRDLGGYVAEARQRVAETVSLPPGYSLAWAGQYEYMQRVQERLSYVIPATLVLVFVLLYLCFRNFAHPLMLLATLPFALVGGFWLLHLLGYAMSVATAVGLILLVGLTAEFGVVMLVYLNEALGRHAPSDRAALRAAIIEGAVMRIRPKIMTTATILAALLPIMLITGVGSEVMQRIAAPMLGGMITAPLVSLVLLPALYYLWHRRGLPEADGGPDLSVASDSP
ncbi:MAG: efflux RND transporter permease subunit [Gammaproteobacteria bacterium]